MGVGVSVVGLVAAAGLIAAANGGTRWYRGSGEPSQLSLIGKETLLLTSGIVRSIVRPGAIAGVGRKRVGACEGGVKCWKGKKRK
ncbi:hypothetical protein BDV95DRAFT_582997 [Massariosphaeria phaeospora]|uniref:Uncharacterized protein n=1 Tax=Massariosphaeria phaeospora TaxID=100035 RepID=A0A7C8I8V9_9PLEO|nr:hypothetical protein BDV95DRAFT_582997 [Massariosphaeria phaeospora]